MASGDRAGEDPHAILAPWGVSRETERRLSDFVAELRRWQHVKNLVGPQTLGDVWTRHVADSLQLTALAPDARTWLDLGSGAGFPGLVIGIWILERPAGGHVHLVESNARKCAFLRHAARRTGAAVTVHDARIEDIIGDFAGRIDVVTARALAPLADLLALAEPLLRSGATGLFPKGQDLDAELTEAAKSWRFTPDIIPSRTDSRGRIVRIRGLRETDHP